MQCWYMCQNDMFWGKGCPYSPSFREQSFSETEELLFVLPSPLIYYPLNERKPRACTSPASLPGVDSSWSTASLRLAAAASAAAGRCADRRGCVLLAVGLFIAAVRTFRAAATPVPGNRPTTTIVRTGPYRFSRNPIYLAFSALQV